MDYLDAYSFDIVIDGTEFEHEPSQYIFSMTESIYKLFPEVRFVAKDTHAIYREFQLLPVGREMSITYGVRGEEKSVDLVVTANETDNFYSQGSLAGDLVARLTHKWRGQQSVKSRGYSGKISSVVEEIASNGDFSGYDIEQTKNDDVWLRPMISEKEMIKEILEPNALASTGDATPFYTYITTDNEFHFRSLASMREEEPVTEFIYEPFSPRSQSQERVLDLKVYTESMSAHYGNRKQQIIGVGSDSGSIESEEVKITKYFANEAAPYIGSFDNNTGVQFKGVYGRTPEEEQNRKAQTISQFKHSLLTDHIVLTVPLNRGVRAGNTISLDCRLLEDEEGGMDSEYYTDDFVVEQVTHSWNGNTASGATRIVAGRDSVSLPSDYLVKDQLLQ